jgi:hypothetical protein
MELGQMVPAGRAFYDILVKDGYNVSLVQEPETSLRMMWLPPSASLLNKMDLVFLSRIAMGEP